MKDHFIALEAILFTIVREMLLCLQNTLVSRITTKK